MTIMSHVTYLGLEALKERRTKGEKGRSDGVWYILREINAQRIRLLGAVVVVWLCYVETGGYGAAGDAAARLRRGTQR